MVIQQMLDLGHRVDDAGYAHIMVDGSDEISGVLRQINIKVPGALQQLRLAVGQVGAQHSLDDAVIVGFVELIQTGSEQREGGTGKDVLGTAHLQLIADVQHGLAGSDNIIGNEDVLTLDILAQVFMGNNGVANRTCLTPVFSLKENKLSMIFLLPATKISTLCSNKISKSPLCCDKIIHSCGF